MSSMQPDEILSRLRSFALRAKNPTVSMEVFLRFLSSENPDVGNLDAAVRDLSFRGEFSLSMDGGRLVSITFADFPLLALEQEYRRLLQDPGLPFPRMETLPIPIPERELPPLEAKGSLGPLMEAHPAAIEGAVKLTFPEDTPAIVVPRSCIGPDLVDAAVARISRYLQEPREGAFLESKLLGVLKGNEAPARQMLEDITLRPRKAAFYVISPTEFSFRFWSHLTQILLADVLSKGSRRDTDLTLLQSAYLVSFAAFYRKGAAEREKERAVDRKGLEVLVRKPPYVFSTQAIYAFKDGKGAVLSEKHGGQFIASFLEESSTPRDEESLPYLVRLHAAAEKKDYYIQQEFVVPVFLKVIGDAGDRLRVDFVQEWVQSMRRDRPPPICRTDALFRREVDRRVRSAFPLVAALANPALLQLAAMSTSLTDEAREALGRCFLDEERLRPMHSLLRLSRQRLFREARSYLPFWQTAPLISDIARFLIRLFRGHGTEEEAPAFDPRKAAASVSFPRVGGPGAMNGFGTPASGGPSPATRAGSDAQELERLRRALRTLMARYVPEGSSVSRTLDELAERWNPLIEVGQKQDLVKDVNALARDFLRPIRRSLLAHPPDEHRIVALAEQLAASKSLATIIDRESLLKYLALYMLHTLLPQ